MSKAEKAQKPPKAQKDLAATLVAANREVFGDGAFVSIETITKGLYGMPLPRNLPLQYLLGLDALPYEKVYNIRGETATTKSTFANYLMALGRLHLGFGYYYETEHKINPLQLQALSRATCDMPQELFNDRLIFSPCKNVEELFARIGGVLGQVWSQNLLNKHQGVAIAVDSLSNINSIEADAVVHNFAATEKQLAKLYDGAADTEAKDIQKQKGYGEMHKAKKIGDNLKGFGGNHLKGYPVMVLVVNHATYEKDDGPPKPYTVKKVTNAGGRVQHFQYSMTFELEKSADYQETKEGQRYPMIALKGGKACFTFTGSRRIKVPLITKSVPDGNGGWYDLQSYDWDMALAILLTDEKGPLTLDQEVRLRKLLPSLKREGARYTCKELGLEQVSARQLGRAIHDCEPLCRQLREIVFSIASITKFGVYQHDWDKLRDTSEKFDRNFSAEADIKPFSLAAATAGTDGKPAEVPLPRVKAGNKAAAERVPKPSPLAALEFDVGAPGEPEDAGEPCAVGD